MQVKVLMFMIPFLLCAISFSMIAQLSGSYTVGQGGDYSNFDPAVSDLLTQGVNGPVTFNIFPGTYEPSDSTKAIIYIDVLIPGVSETNRVTFMPDAGSGGNVDNVILERTQGSANVDDGTFIELRTDYVTVRNLTLSYADTSTTERVNSAININTQPLFSQLEGIEIIGCKINGKSSTSRIFAGINFWNENLNSIVKDNIINGANNGIYFPEQNWTRNAIIEGNNISDTEIWITGGSQPRGEGILLGANENIVIKSNELDYSGGASGHRGISVGQAQNITIDGNMVINVGAGRGINPNDVFNGIWLFDSDDGLISNNMVSGINTGFRWGIYVRGNNNYILHNSILNPTRDMPGNTPAAALVIDGTGIRVHNNLIMDYSTTGNFVAALNIADTTGNDFDYNNLYAPNVNIARIGNINVPTFTAWQNLGYDQNSVSKTLSFVNSRRDLHLTDCAVADEDIRGIYFPEVPRDFDDELRDQTNPFMGADETDGELPELFSSPSKYESGVASWQFTSADLDGDNDIDIAISNAGIDNSIIWNDGTGIFSFPDHYFFGDDPYSIEAGLLNNDNLNDLIVTTGDSAFIRFNSGNGNFSAPFPIPPITFPPLLTDAYIIDLAVGDVDNDNDDDILIVNHLQDFPPPVNMYAFLNNGSGSFTLEPPFHAGDYIDQVVLRDLNGDDFLDAIMVDAITNNKIYLSMNLGLDGNSNWLGFDDNEIELPNFVTSDPTHSTILVDDFDNANGSDIIIRDAFVTDTLIFYKNDGSGNFLSSKLATHPIHIPRVFASMDYNNDGYPDIISANFSEDIHVLLNDGTGNFELIQLCDISSFGATPWAIVSAEFSGDNMADLAVLSANDTINVYENLGWTPTGIITQRGKNILKEYTLFQNYPNPFNPATSIKFELSKAAQLNLKIYNIRGQLVRTLINRNIEAGYHLVEWDGMSDTGVKVASGMYFYRIAAGRFVQTKKMILMK